MRGRCEQHLRGGVLRRGHLVVAVERGDVPRNIGRHLGHEPRQAVDFVARVVEAGNQQRDDLEPDAHRVQLTDRVENRSDPPAELTIVAIVEALEIDLVEIDPRPQIFRAPAACRFRSTRMPVASPAALTCLNISTAHSLVISGSL